MFNRLSAENMKIAVFGQAYKTDSLKYILQLLGLLDKKNCEVYIVDEVYRLIENQVKSVYKTFDSSKILNPTFDYVISIGGDGTILRAATIIRNSNIPIIGINTGRLGFLANVPKEDMQKAINQLFAGEFHIDKRSLLEASTAEKNIDLGINFALNEISVSRKNTTTMIMIDTYLDNEFLNTYWADGLIIATPTGSTGYSLSCNGPIITPQVKALTITPIAPHNLSIRPLIIRDNATIKIRISSRENKFLLSMDSRIVSLDTDTAIFIKKTNFKLHMIELENQSFLKTLREKLLWGKDTRN